MLFPQVHSISPELSVREVGPKVKVNVMKTVGILGALFSAILVLPVAYAGVPGVVTKGAVGLGQVLAFFRINEMATYFRNADEPAKLFVFGSLFVIGAFLLRRNFIPRDVDAE